MISGQMQHCFHSHLTHRISLIIKLFKQNSICLPDLVPYNKNLRNLYMENFQMSPNLITDSILKPLMAKKLKRHVIQKATLATLQQLGISSIGGEFGELVGQGLTSIRISKVGLGCLQLHIFYIYTNSRANEMQYAQNMDHIPHVLLKKLTPKAVASSQKVKLYSQMFLNTQMKKLLKFYISGTDC